ncbi:MAG: IS1380 family transposase [Dysgonamonadaceae bacterium]|nr:IS1380 family transposase [Dysgonamonadaceae bacterium]
MKLQKVSQTITPFAGISFIHEEFNKSGLFNLIDNYLGVRNTNGYSYGELFRTWFEVFFCGGEVAEDVQKHLRSTLENIPDNNVASPDTLLRVLTELATENTIITSTSGKEYEFNINKKMSDLNIKSLLLTKQLKKGEKYDLDYDNQITKHEKWDAKRTYKNTTGYFPGVATINDKIVYIENRDGNANVKIAQDETLKRTYELLQENEIKIDRSRMDAGSYAKDIIDMVSKHSRLFYIRANRSESMFEQICQINDWVEVEINFKSYEVASIPFRQFFEERNYRLVIMREKSDNAQLDLFTGDYFIYRSILTNDTESSEKEIIEYFNMRGASEKLFDIQNNDFGWKRLPTSDMNSNTVFLILTSMMKNFYNHFIKKVSEAFTDIHLRSRMKRFIFRFICVAGRWIKQSRQWKLRLYTDRPYEKLIMCR